MLVMDRRIRESIIIIDRETGEEIVVAPTGYRGKQVKIGDRGTQERWSGSRFFG